MKAGSGFVNSRCRYGIRGSISHSTPSDDLVLDFQWQVCDGFQNRYANGVRRKRKRIVRVHLLTVVIFSAVYRLRN
ncbi:hypothetical protein J6590_097962 [Homalodisca vitripennis]|nr:hypothetical protein J6590_097962 [Homalodisca vitripennis]